jgi:hypothetical protein
MAKKKSPSTVRIEAAKLRRLGAGNALAQLQLDMLRPEAHDDFETWRVNPVTMLMLDALRELAITPPASYIDTDSIEVQYGVSSALALASSFLNDPRVLYPFLFSGAAPGNPRPLPDADYGVDNMPSNALAGN